VRKEKILTQNILLDGDVYVSLLDGDADGNVYVSARGLDKILVYAPITNGNTSSVTAEP
jgi:hypothetical protein